MDTGLKEDADNFEHFLDRRIFFFSFFKKKKTFRLKVILLKYI